MVPWASRSEREGSDGESQSGIRMTGTTAVEVLVGRPDIEEGNEDDPSGDERSGGRCDAFRTRVTVGVCISHIPNHVG